MNHGTSPQKRSVSNAIWGSDTSAQVAVCITWNSENVALAMWEHCPNHCFLERNCVSARAKGGQAIEFGEMEGDGYPPTFSLRTMACSMSPR